MTGQGQLEPRKKLVRGHFLGDCSERSSQSNFINDDNQYLSLALCKKIGPLSSSELHTQTSIHATYRKLPIKT